MNRFQEKTPGGHTVERHSGKSPSDLRARLERRADLSATSSFRNIRDAEKYTTEVLRTHRYEIERWVKYAPKGRPWRKQFTKSFSEQTGIIISRHNPQVLIGYRVTVSIEMTQFNGRPYFILTSFPVM